MQRLRAQKRWHSILNGPSVWKRFQGRALLITWLFFEPTCAMTTRKEGRGIWGIFSRGCFCRWNVSATAFRSPVSQWALDEMDEGKYSRCRGPLSDCLCKSLEACLKWESHTTHRISPGTLEWWHKCVCVLLLWFGFASRALFPPECPLIYKTLLLDAAVDRHLLLTRKNNRQTLDKYIRNHYLCHILVQLLLFVQQFYYNLK